MDLVDLYSLLQPTPTGEPGRFTLDVREGLQQGRGAWGGVTTGAMVSAAQQVDPRPEMAVRTLSAQLVAPVLVGRVELQVELLRGGTGTTTLGVRMRDAAGAMLAHGVVVLGSARVGAAMTHGLGSLEPPGDLTAGPAGIPAVAIGPPLAPEFAVQLEWRPLRGLPYSGSASDETLGWVRPRGAVSGVDASVVAALADAWWVAAIVQMDRPRPVATLGFTLDLTSDPAHLTRAADGSLDFLLHRGRVLAAREGFTVETRELWTPDGDLVSWNTQTVTVIK